MRNIFDGDRGALTDPSFDDSDLHSNLGVCASALLGVMVVKHAFKKLKEIIEAPELGKRNLYRDLRFKVVTRSKYKKTLKPKFKLNKKQLRRAKRAGKELKRMGWL